MLKFPSLLTFSFALLLLIPGVASAQLGPSTDGGSGGSQISGGSNGGSATDDNTTYVYEGNAVKNFLNSSSSGFPPRPLSLSEAQGLERDNILGDASTGLPFDIRKEAIREGAVSYGARTGLAWRTFGIRQELETRSRYMDKIYNFAHLLIPAPSGFLIEPPIITEDTNAMLIGGNGQEAAVSDRIYNIVNNARIVSNARSWRTYLERNWGDVSPPPDILRPENDEERDLWISLVTRGWEEGVQQANDIFTDDLNLLTRDFEGMVRYRILLAQGMISPPYALQVDRGITGEKSKVLVGGDLVDITTEMRVGDRAVQITGVPELITGSDRWLPANR